MAFKIGLAYLVFLMGRFCVQGYNNCQEYPLKQSDPFSPTQTIRVCGAGDYEDIPIIMRTLLGIEKPKVVKPAQHLLPPFEGSAITSKYSNGFPQNVLAPYNFVEDKQPYPKVVHSIPYNYYAINGNGATEGDLEDFKTIGKPQQQTQKKQNLYSVVDEVAAVKQSFDGLTTYLKSEKQRSEGEHETNINIIFKLDPTLESLVKTIFQSTEETEPQPKEEKPSGEETFGLHSREEKPESEETAELQPKEEKPSGEETFGLQSREEKPESEETAELQSKEEYIDYLKDVYGPGAIDADKANIWLRI
ncbi:uncharacterized protein [Eurosta solidaginis]|uniref:uncharacterized protein isoform X2 n=1 Tax=Eurosta solidaginis TaxID=178769 RepID=UPI00353091E8